MTTKTEKPKSFATKTEKPISKIAKTAKPKIPMSPSLRTSAWEASVRSANSEAASRSLFWAANGLNELREVRSELIGKKTIFFLTGQTWCVNQILEHKWGPRAKISALFRPWWRLHRLGLRSSAAHHCYIQTFLKCFPWTFNQVGASYTF